MCSIVRTLSRSRLSAIVSNILIMTAIYASIVMKPSYVDYGLYTVRIDNMYKLCILSRQDKVVVLYDNRQYIELYDITPVCNIYDVYRILYKTSNSIDYSIYRNAISLNPTDRIYYIDAITDILQLYIDIVGIREIIEEMLDSDDPFSSTRELDRMHVPSYIIYDILPIYTLYHLSKIVPRLLGIYPNRECKLPHIPRHSKYYTTDITIHTNI